MHPSLSEFQLHFALGTATAADELLSRVDLVELEGWANFNKRAALRMPDDKDMRLAIHLQAIAPQVCEILQERE